MLIFNKEKYLNYEIQRIKEEYDNKNSWVNKYNGKKVIELDGNYICDDIEVLEKWCEERKDTMKELLEKWKNTKDTDLIQAIEIIEDLQDKYEGLQEEFEDYKKDVDENYEQKSFDPYEEYGISESDFH